MRDPTTAASHPKSAMISALARIAAEAGIRMDELAIRWVAAHRAASVMLLGMSSIDHLRRNVEILRLPPLEPDIVREIADTAIAVVNGDQP
jgi:aryl-alcohol dehydrogenase-like predicted oxidoreductase